MLLIENLCNRNPLNAGEGEVWDATLPPSLFSVAALHFHIKQVDGKSLYISFLLLKATPLNPPAACHRWHARLSCVCTGHRSATAVHQAHIELPVCKKVGTYCKVRIVSCLITLLDQSYALR